MLLAVDIGNSAIKFGVFDSAFLVDKTSINTAAVLSSPSELSAHLEFLQKQFPSIKSVLVCSVVPNVGGHLSATIKERLGFNAEFVDHRFNFGINSVYDPIASLGIDRLVNVSAAASNYGAPIIVCSFGTATTIDVVDETGTHLGGTIAPGLGLLTNALHNFTAKLPLVDIESPENLLGTNTTASIRSGIFYGHIGGVESIVQRINEQIGNQPTVVATGGFAKLMAGSSRLIDEVEENLTLEGIRMLHDRRNR